MQTILAALIAVMLMLVAGATLLSRHVARRRRRRLQSLTREGGKPMAATPDGPDLFPARLMPAAVARNLRQLGLEPTLRDAVLTAAAVALPVAAVAVFFNLLAALMLGATAIMAGFAVLNILAARRVAQLGATLPGFFDRVRQLLAIGNSLPTAFARAALAAQPSLKAFFTPTLRRIGNGAAFSDSIQQCAEDIDAYEMHLFAAAIATNMRFGGSLIQSLNNLVAYLRKRASIERELRSSTAQIRASAWVLGLLPMLVAGLIIVQNRDYASWFITNPTGKWMLGYCLVSQVIGAFVMRMIVRTKF